MLKGSFQLQTDRSVQGEKFILVKLAFVQADEARG
jgi:hypothetical protein